jgi:predicted MFS family arabinose efflux permease
MSVLSALSLARVPARAFFALGIFWGCFAAQVPVLKAGLAVSDGRFGTLLLGSACGLMTAMWLAPRADRLLGPRGMQAALVALAAAMLLPGAAPAPLAFFAAMLVMGTCSGLLDVLMNARVSELEEVSGRSLMNASHGSFSLGYAAGALATGLAREAGLGPLTIFAAGALMLACIAASLRMAPLASVPDPGASAAPSPLWPVALCGAVTLVAFMSEATVEAWSALHVERTLGGSAAEGALGPAMLGLTMAVGRFSGQLVAERLREWQVIIAAACLSASGALVVAAASSPAVAYLGFGVLGLGVSVIAPMGLALAGRLVAPHQRTQVISRVAVIGFAGLFFAPALMGHTSEAFGLRAAFASVAGLLLTAVPLALVLRGLQRAGRAAA